MFFQHLSTIKVKVVDKMMQSVYLCLSLNVQHKKYFQFLAVLTWFLILGIIQDGDHCWWRDRPPAAPPPIKYTSSCWQRRSGAFHWRQNIFKTSIRMGSINPRPPCTTVGVWISAYVRRLNQCNAFKKSTKFSKKINFWAQQNQL